VPGAARPGRAGARCPVGLRAVPSAPARGLPGGARGFQGVRAAPLGSFELAFIKWCLLPRQVDAMNKPSVIVVSCQDKSGPVGEQIGRATGVCVCVVGGVTPTSYLPGTNWVPLHPLRRMVLVSDVVSVVIVRVNSVRLSALYLSLPCTLAFPSRHFVVRTLGNRVFVACAGRVRMRSTAPSIVCISLAVFSILAPAYREVCAPNHLDRRNISAPSLDILAACAPGVAGICDHLDRRNIWS
jgi:hypothetical protein